MENKLIIYLPVIGIFITIGLLVYNFASITPPEPEGSLDNVLKNLNSAESGSNVNNSENKGNTQMDKTKMPRPIQVINPAKDYLAIIKTNKGDIKIKLYSKTTPQTVNNFVYLSQSKFYDGVIFHRVIKEFMIQGGDPLGSGMGGPGYSFNDEKSDKNLVKGSLAMANAGPNTNGSQFFIVTAEQTPWLDGKHTNFGEVIEGIEVVESIENSQTDRNDRPLEEITIKTIEIIEE
jgi:peptidyl-prolyl cis-trans isomerase B (cyclophilin B)